MTTKWFFTLLMAVGLGICSTKAGTSAYTPAPGNPERQAIMDVMRLDFYRNDLAGAHRNADGIFFKVQFLRVHGDWALTFVQPVNGNDADYAEPRWGLLHRKNGKWVTVDYFDALGPYANDTAADDVLDMTPATIRKMWRVFTNIPRDIFPN